MAYKHKRKYKMTTKHRTNISKGLKIYHKRRRKKKKHQEGTPYSGTFYGYQGYPFGFSMNRPSREGFNLGRINGGGRFRGGGHK